MNTHPSSGARPIPAAERGPNRFSLGFSGNFVAAQHPGGEPWYKARRNPHHPPAAPLSELTSLFCERTWEELFQFSADQASCDLCGARFVTAMDNAPSILDAAQRQAPIAVPQEWNTFAESAYAGTARLLHRRSTPTDLANAVRTALNDWIQAELGPGEAYGSRTLSLGPLEPTPAGFSLTFGFLDDRDSFSMYDKSTQWRGQAVFVQRQGSVSLQFTEMTVVDAGQYHYHPLGEVRRWTAAS